MPIRKTGVRSIRKVTDRVFDVHLMIVDPDRYLKEFKACGADSITFHLEAIYQTSSFPPQCCLRTALCHHVYFTKPFAQAGL